MGRSDLSPASVQSESCRYRTAISLSPERYFSPLPVIFVWARFSQDSFLIPWQYFNPASVIRVPSRYRYLKYLTFRRSLSNARFASVTAFPEKLISAIGL